MKTFLSALAAGATFLWAATAVAAGPLSRPVIVVDPGHGGRDFGAQVNGLNEKDLNLAVSRTLAKCLKSAGAQVLMTRSGDANLLSDREHGNLQRKNLEARVQLADRVHADLLLSIHVNRYSDSAAHGGQVFIGENPSPERQRLGACLQSELGPATDSRRQVDQERPLYLMRHLKIPAALIEVGFMSNRHEAQLLLQDSYRTRVARAITRGVICYYRGGASPPLPLPGPSAAQNAHRRALVPLAHRVSAQAPAHEVEIDARAGAQHLGA